MTNFACNLGSSNYIKKYLDFELGLQLKQALPLEMGDNNTNELRKYCAFSQTSIFLQLPGHAFKSLHSTKVCRAFCQSKNECQRRKQTRKFKE